MPGYQVKFETHLLGTSHFEIRSLLDRQQYADPDGAALAAGISSASWPLFGMVWPSARMLANAMQTYDIAGKRILEIGCGLALASLVIHRRLGDITASDCHPLTAAFLADNVLRNDLPALKYQTGHWGRENLGLGQFDLIIASDVLYERDQPETLSQFIHLHSADPVSIIVLDPDRGNRKGFCRKMEALGYTLDLQRAGSTQSTGEAYKGHFLNFSRS
ncbi:SAM-dependent methyltransferase [Rhodoferax sp. AJA081-3]|uniref:class I SAM-dependent methyltransferase n=1 Tax=Rhodoferax sp. AJA081-3 TaxID=2752316 RepID=UPI001ADFEA10|nr:SAM-dependent methyltransferase [Rhodoferax sp. AJA081-3]QTN29556.1 SAM-dependent methyltransferase [Rhodoferax sp. AJA081-3]